MRRAKKPSTTCLSHCPCSGMDRCRRRLNSSLVSLSFACMRSRRVFLLRRNLPRRDVPQMSVKRLKPCTHHFEKPTRVGLALEPNHYIISISRDDHVAGGLAPSPALRPEIKDVVQIDVGEQWLDHRSLSRTPVTRRHDPIFEHTRLEPFLYQADDAPITDPVFQKTHQPFLTDRIKEALNVGVDDPAHLRAADPSHQRVQRIVLAAFWPESI